MTPLNQSCVAAVQHFFGMCATLVWHGRQRKSNLLKAEPLGHGSTNLVTRLWCAEARADDSMRCSSRQRSARIPCWQHCGSIRRQLACAVDNRNRLAKFHATKLEMRRKPVATLIGVTWPYVLSSYVVTAPVVTSHRQRGDDEPQARPVAVLVVGPATSYVAYRHSPRRSPPSAAESTERTAD
jgi:hypothetical protein